MVDPARKRALRILLWLVIGITLSGAPKARMLSQNCSGCHGPEGISAARYIPSIAGLNFRYLYATLQDFKKDRRPSTVMGRIAKGYKTSELQHLALRFGRRPWTASPRATNPERARQGRDLHQKYCEKCHKESGRFQDKDTPPLAGQAQGYLLLKMHDYRSAVGAQPPLMQERLEKLHDQDLSALSEFYVSDLAAGDGKVPGAGME